MDWCDILLCYYITKNVCVFLCATKLTTLPASIDRNIESGISTIVPVRLGKSHYLDNVNPLLNTSIGVESSLDTRNEDDRDRGRKHRKSCKRGKEESYGSKKKHREDIPKRSQSRSRHTHSTHTMLPSKHQYPRNSGGYPSPHSSQRVCGGEKSGAEILHRETETEGIGTVSEGETRRDESISPDSLWLCKDSKFRTTSGR